MAAIPDHLDFAMGGGALGRQVKEFGLGRFGALAEQVRALAYRRPRDADPLAILREGCGTCSSKHRLLALVAHESGRTDIQLAIGIYEMSERNTPGVGTVLSAAAMAFVPEAHCYLTAGADRLDLTGLPGGAVSVFDSLLVERVVSPGDLPAIKQAWHREFVERWAQARNLSPAKVWRVREACITSLMR